MKCYFKEEILLVKLYCQTNLVDLKVC